MFSDRFSNVLTLQRPNQKPKWIDNEKSEKMRVIKPQQNMPGPYFWAVLSSQQVSGRYILEDGSQM